jgi:hypothetical protein
MAFIFSSTNYPVCKHIPFQYFVSSVFLTVKIIHRITEPVIRIRINFGRLDLYLHLECGFGPRSRRAKMTTNIEKSYEISCAECSLLRAEGFCCYWTSFMEA